MVAMKINDYLAILGFCHNSFEDKKDLRNI